MTTLAKLDKATKELWCDMMFREISWPAPKWFEAFIVYGPFPYEEIKVMWR